MTETRRPGSGMWRGAAVLALALGVANVGNASSWASDRERDTRASGARREVIARESLAEVWPLGFGFDPRMLAEPSAPAILSAMCLVGLIGYRLRRRLLAAAEAA